MSFQPFYEKVTNVSANSFWHYRLSFLHMFGIISFLYNNIYILLSVTFQYDFNIFYRFTLLDTNDPSGLMPR